MPELTVTTHHQLQVGASQGNSITLEIETAEDIDLLARIEIRCGNATPGKTFLCRDAQLARIRVESDPADAIDGSLTRKGSAEKTTQALVWDSSNFFPLAANSKIVLKMTGFTPTGSGAAELHLKIWCDPDALTVIHDKPIAVSVAPAPGPAVIDFNVSVCSIAQGDEVTLTAYTVNAKAVNLYGNEVPIPPERSESVMPGAVETTHRFSHKPQKTTQYRLEAWRDLVPGPPEAVATREVTVQVEPRPHWYSWDLLANSLVGGDHGQDWHPAQLLSAMDLSGRTDGQRLYGIFVNKKTQEASLWSSSSGLDGWRWESDVPAGMHDSPAVVHNQVLWLVGGSAVDPLAPATNRVFWYYLDNSKNEMVWKECDPLGVQRAAGQWPIARRCHACASFDGKVWMLGGLSEQDQELDDVWTCSADPRDGNLTAVWKPAQKLPAGRCMATSAVTPAGNEMRSIGGARLWLFGGTTHPYNIDATFDQLLWTDDGKSWHEFELPWAKRENSLVRTLAATLLYGADGYLYLAGVFRDRGHVHVRFEKLLGEDLEETPWSSELKGEFGWDFQTDLFLIGSVAFNGRWILWPNYQDWTGKKKYLARIYNTP